MFLIAIFLANGCIFHTYEENSVYLPRCLLCHTIVAAYKYFISVFMLLSTIQMQYVFVNHILSLFLRRCGPTRAMAS
jgi:hypothetical protein